ncbi:MAG TPA: hypothetical protein DDW65_09195 [Firmicutes bacterium]|jgi:hypothetical protein|nr:hypothetical protein [Bacillota bacterium]
MWISQFLNMYRPLFLLVRIRFGGFRLTLPLALFLIDETFDILADLLWLAEKLTPVKISSGYPDFDWKWTIPRFKETPTYSFPAHQILELSRELLNELRRYGRYSLVEVKTGAGPHKQHVSVELF